MLARERERDDRDLEQHPGEGLLLRKRQNARRRDHRVHGPEGGEFPVERVKPQRHDRIA